MEGRKGVLLEILLQHPTCVCFVGTLHGGKQAYVALRCTPIISNKFGNMIVADCA